jgi:hypothetical protein
MIVPQSHIPTEVYLDLLGRTVPIRWDYHAVLMFVIWLVLVPLSILTIRFGKPRPTPYGIKERIQLTNLAWWWFNVHKFILYAAIALAVLGAAVAMVVSRGFSGTVHGVLGLTAVALGCLQVASSWFRGTHGGRYYYTADPDNPATWHGDHFSMTPRRRLFEAFHKNVGYFTAFFAVGAIASGLMQYPMPGLTVVMVATAALIVVLCIVLEHRGRRHDTYRAVFGNNPEHPYNKARKDL